MSPYDRGIIEFTVGRKEVLRGIDEGVVGMCTGDIRRLTIPPELGYSKGFPGYPELISTLIYEVEVLIIK
jgi:FKBP-type peptidyl-prolyl cis-trans isomerase